MTACSWILAYSSSVREPGLGHGRHPGGVALGIFVAGLQGRDQGLHAPQDVFVFLLVMAVALGQKLFHHQEHLFHVEGFDEIPTDAQAFAALDVAGAITGAHHDHEGVVQFRNLSQGLAQTVAV